MKGLKKCNECGLADVSGGKSNEGVRARKLGLCLACSRSTATRRKWAVELGVPMRFRRTPAEIAAGAGRAGHAAGNAGRHRLGEAFRESVLRAGVESIRKLCDEFEEELDGRLDRPTAELLPAPPARRQAPPRAAAGPARKQLPAPRPERRAGRRLANEHGALKRAIIAVLKAEKGPLAPIEIALRLNGHGYDRGSADDVTVSKRVSTCLRQTRNTFQHVGPALGWTLKGK